MPLALAALSGQVNGERIGQMTGPDELVSACHHSLTKCLQAVVDHCPELPAAAPLLQRLGDLLPAHQAAFSLPAGAPTLEEVLTLLANAQSQLRTLQGTGAANPVGAELHQSLSETIKALAAALGREVRARQADRVRGLYVIIDPEVTGGREPLEIARASVRGGARMLQLRDKLRDKGLILPLARDLQELCQANDVLLIINDHVDLAAAVGAGGVHVGQTDLPVAEARKVLAPHQVLGRSNREIDLITQSQDMGADHVAFGAIYPSTTKGGGRGPQGIQPLLRAREAAKVPLVAIGGINADNAAPVVEAGADAICVTAAVASAPEPEAAAERLVNVIREAGGRV